MYQKARDGYPDALRSLLEAESVFEEEDQERGLEHLFNELTMIGFDMIHAPEKDPMDHLFRDDLTDLRCLYNMVRKEVDRLIRETMDLMSVQECRAAVEKWRKWREERPEIQETKNFVALTMIGRKERNDG